MESIRLLAPFIQTYGYLVIFLGAAVFGETVIFGRDFFVFFRLSEFLSDHPGQPLRRGFFRYLLVSHRLSDQSPCDWPAPGNFRRRLNSKLDFLKSQFQQDHEKFLVYSKFIYGMRIAVLAFGRL